MLERFDDSINSKIEDSRSAPIDLTTIDNSKHPITIENPKLSKALITQLLAIFKKLC